MANVYSQLYIQIVFAVKGRKSLIKESFRVELQKYITGVVQAKGHKLLAIYCMPDHTHLLIGLKPNLPISELVQDVKTSSNKLIKDKKFLQTKFEWQKGYGAFSYSKSALDNVVKYILNQPEHHKKRNFKEEYLLLLKKFEIEYDEKYLFEWIDEI
ncbi:IS200/IS605 family transposase [Bernardetia sp.]|uniref:IS200/IS605 family transposase n=1 Tax=Bernardetia sp. TaxID=1937974 RepID=UPI0025C2CFE1|nr:IS200/IS605 family transposase [Bernardetia sp.]